MIIALRIEPNGSLYLNKDIIDRNIPKNELMIAPYNYTLKEIDDKYADLTNADFNGLEFSVEKYTARKHREEIEPQIAELKQRIEELSQDIVQDMAGEVVPDIEERKAEFVELHNELRELLGKDIREVKNATDKE